MRQILSISGWCRPVWMRAALFPGISPSQQQRRFREEIKPRPLQADGASSTFETHSPVTFALVFLIFASFSVKAWSATIDWSSTAATTALATGTNWIGGTAPTNNLTSDIARFDQTSYLSQPNAGTTSINGIQIGDGATVTATLTLTNTALSIGGSGITMFANAGAATLTGGSIKIGANQSWSNDSSNLLTISSALSNTGNTTPFTLTLNGSGNGGTTIGGLISNGGTTGTTALVVNRPNGVATLSGINTYTGGTTLTLGTLKLSGSGTLGGTSGALTVNGGILDLNGTSQGAGNFTGAGGTILNNSTGTNVTLTIGNGNGTGGNYSGVIADNTSGTGTIALTKTGTGTLTLSGANSYTGATTVSAGVLNVQNATGLGTTAGGTTVSNGATLQLQNNITVGAEALGIRGTGASGQNGALVNVSGTNNYGGLLTLAAATTLASDSGTLNLTNTGTITGATFGLTLTGSGDGSIASIIGTTSGTLIKSGTGTWTLTGANSYTGTTTISAGTLNIQNATGLGTTGAGTTVSSGATLQLQNNITVGTEGLTVSGTGAAGQNGALVNVSGTSNYGGLLTLGAAATVSSDSGRLNLTNTGTITGNAFGLTLTGSGDGSVSSIIGTTSGTLIKSGSGTWTLSGANTFTGQLTVQAGTLSIDTINNASASGELGNNALSVILGNTGGVTGTLEYTGATASSSKKFTMATAGTGAFQIDTVGTILTLAGIIDGSGTLNKTGAGTLTLTGVNTYTGGTTINAGIVVTNSASSFGATAGGVNVNAGTVEVSTGFSTSRVYTLGSSSSTFNVDASQTFTVTSAVGGSGTLNKTGSGTMVLNGASTYNGGTVISGGTLSLDSNGSSSARLVSTSGITLNSGGTLLLANSTGTASNDRINNSATMSLNGGALNTGGLSEHGASNNTAGLGALTLQSTSIIDMGSGASILAFANSLAQSASWVGTLKIYNWTGTPQTGGGTDQLFFGNDSTGLTASQLLDVQFYSGSGTGAYGAGALILATGEVVAIPEASNWIASVLAGLALAALHFQQSRHHILARRLRERVAFLRSRLK